MSKQRKDARPQHTPGPWHVGALGYIRSSTSPVARIVNRESSTKANAALIAAAPELLALAKLIAPLNEAEGLSSAALGVLIDRAKDVIRKAEGSEE